MNILKAIVNDIRSLNRRVVSIQQTTVSNDTVAALRDNVPTSGDTLNKLYNLIQTLNALVTGTTPDGDNVTNTIQEILQVFATYPEGTDIFNLLSQKFPASGFTAAAINALYGYTPANSTALASEITNRTNADTALQASITGNTTNIAANTSAISANGTAISNEVTNRTNADTGLQTQINTNTINISANATAIGTEVTNRTNADTGLQTQINGKLAATGGDLTGTAGTGYIGFIAQSSKPATPSTGLKVYSDSSNKFSWLGTNGFVRTFDGTANTADRAYVLPDGSGTIALNELAQTFSASKSFSTTGDLSFYNTADQVTNYERVRVFWSGNVFSFISENGGTGTGRTFKIGTSSKTMLIGTFGLVGMFNFDGGGSTNNTNIGLTGIYSSTNGIQNLQAILPTINQSGTAGYKAIWISPYEQTVGSGTKYLIDAGTNSAANGGGTHTSKFSVDNTGNVISTGNISCGTVVSGTISAGGSSNLRLSSGTGNILFQTNSTSNTWGTMFYATGNLVLQNGGSFTDAGYRLDVQGTARISSDLQVEGALKQTVQFNTQTASYTLVLADRGKDVEMNLASANTLTIPLNSSVAFPVGSQIDVMSIGLGQTTITPTVGVTILSADGATKLRTQYSQCTLTKRATDTWYLVGDLV